MRRCKPARTGESAAYETRATLSGIATRGVAAIDVPMAVGHRVRGSPLRDRGGERVQAAGMFHLREIRPLRPQLSEQAVLVVPDALADDDDSQPMRRQRVFRQCGTGFPNVIDRRGPEGIDLMSRPQVRRQLFGEDGRRVDPIGLLESLGKAEFCRTAPSPSPIARGERFVRYANCRSTSLRSAGNFQS